VANFGFERENFVLLLNTWLRIPETVTTTTIPTSRAISATANSGILFLENQRFGAMVRNNFNFDDNHGALQLEWAFPSSMGQRLYPVFSRLRRACSTITTASGVSSGLYDKDWD